jgi:hypothetical protein
MEEFREGLLFVDRIRQIRVQPPVVNDLLSDLKQTRRKAVALTASAGQNNVILGLDVSAFISYCWCDLVASR